MGVIMEMEEAKEKAKDVMDKVVVSSKDAFSKAGNAIQKFSDKSVLKIEIMQLKSKRKNAVSKLGVYAEKKFYAENAESISRSEDEVSKLLDEIKNLDSQINERTEQLNQK